MSKSKVDPITLEVVRGGLTSLCAEMGVAMERSAYSPIFSEGLDYSYAMFDGKTDMITQAAFDPCHLGAMPYSVKSSINEIGLENLEPGDIILHNDPYSGGSHISDFTAMLPIFYKGEIVAMPATRAHQIDSGAMVPGGFAGDASDIFQEGLRIPPIKVNSKNRESTDIWKLILANVRLPRAVEGDLRAMFGALQVGEHRITQLVEKYGIPTWTSCLDEIKNVSERIIRSEIQRIPTGSYEYEDYIDDTGRTATPAKIHVRIDVKGDELVADYSGSSPQVAGPINAAFAVTAGNTLIGVLHSVEIGGDYVVNQGTFRPIHVEIPKGTIVNPNYPAPVQGGNTETSNRIVDVVIGALAQATTPNRIKAACHGTCSGITVSGFHSEADEQFIAYLWGLGGMGARIAGDGNCAQLPFATNNKGPFIEVSEIRYPFLFEEYALGRPDSAGPGKFRGGMGTRLVWRIRAKESNLSALSERHRFSPYGVFGGLSPIPRVCGHFCDTRLRINGQPAFAHATELFQKASPSKWSNIILHEGDQVELTLCGGGGWGPPYERDPEAVLSDVTNGFVTMDGARNHYGIIIDPSTMKINSRETEKVRQIMKTKGPHVELPSQVKILFTFAFPKLDEKQRRRLHEFARECCVIFVRDHTQNTVIKLQGRDFPETISIASKIAEILGVEETLPLTMQYVPSQWNP
ncbi:MAG: hydantoinase B/oxoprolinase family protein [Candidatus Bathyarchaeia archaeon]